MSVILVLQTAAVLVIGGILVYLAICRRMEPALLLPMGFGAILVNLPSSGAAGVMEHLFSIGIGGHELFPLLLFIGIGAMMDFGPLLENPKLFLFGFAAQAGILFVFLLTRALGFTPNDAASIAIIGAADGPTAIYVAQKLRSGYIAPIMVSAYSYMALVPIIQPPVIKLCTTKRERRIRMAYIPQKATRRKRILFPIAVAVAAGIIAPDTAALIGFLMFGNLLRECGVLDSLAETARNHFANALTILLGLSISARMTAPELIRWETLLILTMGLVAFAVDTAGGVLLAKVWNLFARKKINPMIGAAGISAFPMASRVVQKMGLAEDNQNHLLMHAAAVNVSGQIASVIVGGLLLRMIYY